MERTEYNKKVLKSCLANLQSHDPNDVYEGVVSAAYLIEQAFKAELRSIHPLLYFDRRGLTDELEIRIVTGRLTKEDLKKLKTSPARRILIYMCEKEIVLRPHKASLEELFGMRNTIVHSIDNVPFYELTAAETSVSMLKVCAGLIIKNCGISIEDFNPLTSREFDRLQLEGKKKRLQELEDRIEFHKQVFEKLDEPEVAKRMTANRPETSITTWIESTFECPACGRDSFDEIAGVDFDWNPDGILEGYGVSYLCRVCGLDLSEHEYELVRTL